MESHISKAGKRLSLCQQRTPPEGSDGSLDIKLERLLWRGGDHGLEGVREGVLLGEISDLSEPGVLDAMVEDIEAMLVENVAWTKEGHHVEEGELVLMDQCRCREGA